MEKMTQMLVVKVTQLQGQHLGSEDPPCPAGAPSAWGWGASRIPVSQCRGVLRFPWADLPAAAGSILTIPGPALGEVQLLACPRARQSAVVLQFPHTFQLQLTSLGSFFSCCYAFLKMKIFSFYQQHFILC